MATEAIGPSGLPVQPDAARKSTAQRADQTQQTSVPSGPAADETAAANEQERPSGEKVQISQEAHDLLRMRELMSDARRKLDETPEVRQERIQEVRERLEAGVYDTKGIRDEVAHRLTSILGDLPLKSSDDAR